MLKSAKQKILLGALAILAIAVLAYWISPNLLTPKKPSVPVKVQKVKIDTVTEKILSVGNLAALRDVFLSAEGTGYVIKINFTDGQAVKAGDLLFQLDNTKEQAALTSAQADYQQTNNKYIRMQDLMKGHYVSAQDLEIARADVQAKVSAVRNAQDNLNKRAITAPFDGVLGAKMVNIGDSVAPGQKLVEIVDRSALKVNYSVPEKYLAKIGLDQTVTVMPTDVSSKQFLGKVVFISPSIDAQTHTINVQANVPNPTNELAPGLFVQVSQLIRSSPNAILVPEEALVKSPDKTLVYRVQNNKALATEVTTGITQNGDVEILSGLSPNDQIVIAGQDRLNDGDPVQTF